jgi:uncharacterized protein (TIGR02246 family)
MKRIILFFSLLIFTTQVQAQSVTDEQAIRNVIQKLEKGWNNASGETFASVFTDTHDFIVWNGYYFKGQNIEDNTRTHDYIFSSMYKGTQLFLTVDKIRFIREDIALVHVFGSVVGKSETRPKDPQVLISMIVEKTNEDWKISSFHNLDLEVFQNEDMLKGSPVPAAVMYASWYAESK